MAEAERSDHQRVTFHTEPLTIGELVLIERLKDQQRNDVAALLELLVSRSRRPAVYFANLPATELMPLTERLVETLKVSTTLTNLALRWQASNEPDPGRK